MLRLAELKVWPTTPVLFSIWKFSVKRNGFQTQTFVLMTSPSENWKIYLYWLRRFYKNIFVVLCYSWHQKEYLVWSRHSMRHTGHTNQIYGRICRLHWVVKYVFTCSAKSLLLKTLFHQIFLKKRFSPRRICSMLLWDRTTPYWCCGIQTASYWKEVESPLAWNSCGSTPSTEVSCGIWNHRYRRLFEKF